MRILIIICVLLLAVNAFGFRVGRPPMLSLPLTEDQVAQLNDFNESIFYLQQGEFNFDVTTSVKTNADNGDFWIILTGGEATIQFKANDHIYSIKAK